MTRTALPFRPASFALCLLTLSVTVGCAHFRDAEERAAQRQADAQRPSPALAETEAIPPAAPPPAPMAAAMPPAEPAPAQAPPEVAAMPAPTAKVTVQTRATPAIPQATKAPHAPAPPSAETSARQPVLEAPATFTLAPSSTAPPVTSTGRANTGGGAFAPATANAVIIFTNTPGGRCGTCETVKISVAPSGQVLMERGQWQGNHRDWRYQRSRAEVGPARAAAFAASLSGVRPTGDQLLAGGATCPGPATADDGLVIEWIEADRHDLLTVNFRCPARRDSEQIEKLRHAPDLLGLPKLVFPWGAAQ